jgi:PhzF family phenazine biosynthesis protein
MVGLKSEATLHQLSYDSNELSRIIDKIGAIRVQIFCMENAQKFHVRDFCPTIGIPEDPATGSAAGAFGAYLVDQGILKEKINQFEISQGQAMGRPSTIFVNIEQSKKSGKS